MIEHNKNRSFWRITGVNPLLRNRESNQLRKKEREKLGFKKKRIYLPFISNQSLRSSASSSQLNTCNLLALEGESLVSTLRLIVSFVRSSGMTRVFLLFSNYYRDYYYYYYKGVYLALVSESSR